MKNKYLKYLILKRYFNLFFATFLFLISLPFLIIFSIIIFLETHEFPILVQKRALALNSNVINVYKLKTMKSCKSNSIKDVFIKKDLFKFLTPTGKLLRKMGLDELPQLINVIKGEMSLIGPRPLTIEDLIYLYTYYPELIKRREKIKCLPGITGYWQIYGKREEGVKNLIDLDEYYEKNLSLKLDLTLLIRTLPVIFLAKHKDAINFSINKNNLEFTKNVQLIKEEFCNKDNIITQIVKFM